MKRITIIVPCYNEEEVLEYFYQEIQKYFVSGYDFKLLFVNDGSKDNTINIIKSLREKDDRVKYISFSRNFGKEAAMLAGLRGAKDLNSDACILIDADLQDPPSLILEMLKYYEEGYKHIYAKHKTRKGESKLKTFFALMFYKVYSLITKDKNLNKGARDFCLMDKAVIDAFLSIKDINRFTKGISSWVGFEKKCIEFDYVERKAGTTKWSFKKLFNYAMLGIRQFSHLYKIITKLFVIISFVVLSVDLYVSIKNKTFNRQMLIIEVLLFFMFICLDVVMKLLYDIRDQGLNRPIYVIEDSNTND